MATNAPKVVQVLDSEGNPLSNTSAAMARLLLRLKSVSLIHKGTYANPTDTSNMTVIQQNVPYVNYKYPFTFIEATTAAELNSHNKDQFISPFPFFISSTGYFFVKTSDNTLPIQAKLYIDDTATVSNWILITSELISVLQGQFYYKVTIKLQKFIGNFVPIGSCFRFQFSQTNPGSGQENIRGYSNTLIYNTGISGLGNIYFNKNREYHFFTYGKTETDLQLVLLICKINSPNAKTKITEYEDANGYNHLLSKVRRMEYDVEFDFYAEYFHRSILEMLSSPILRIDDNVEGDTHYEMYESGDYDIDWDNADEHGFARSKTKLSEQDIIKYSNCN